MAVDDDFGNAADRAGDDRNAAGARFQGRDAERLAYHARHDEKIELLHESRHVGVRQAADDVHRPRPVRVRSNEHAGTRPMGRRPRESTSSPAAGRGRRQTPRAGRPVRRCGESLLTKPSTIVLEAPGSRRAAGVNCSQSTPNGTTRIGAIGRDELFSFPSPETRDVAVTHVACLSRLVIRLTVSAGGGAFRLEDHVRSVRADDEPPAGAVVEVVARLAGHEMDVHDVRVDGG